MILGKNRLILGEIKGNPYSIKTMRRAAQILHLEKGYPLPEIFPNALYVRFYPTDAKQYNFLIEESGFELFNYPLDRSIVQLGEIYRDPDLPSWAIYPWLYTTIYPHQRDLLATLQERFPKMKMEELQQCYVPMSSSTDSQYSYEQELERQAIQLVENYLPTNQHSSDEARESRNPKCQLSYLDNQTNQVIPVKGIKIRANYYVKWSSSYTDDSGVCESLLPFPAEPCYSIVFQNVCQFSIFQGIDLVYPILIMMDKGDREGIEYCISKDNPVWSAAVINDAAYDYYNFCRQEGLTLPPPFLKIWHWNRFGDLSSAPMLKHLSGSIGYHAGFKVWRWLGFALKGFGVNFALFSLGALSPDILVGRCRVKSTVIYNSVTHELAHASHFAQVGSSYWKRYISFILSHRELYGTAKSKDSGICALGEMWGYSMGNLMEARKFGYAHYSGAGQWFQPLKLQKLISHGTLKESDILKALTPEVLTIEAFRNKLIHLYPDKYAEIDEIFS